MASVILLLAAYGFWDLGDRRESRSLDNRLNRAWRHFDLYCLAESFKPSALRGFSRDKLHCGRTTAATFPFVSCKGSDTVLLLKWLYFVATLHLGSEPGSRSAQLTQLLQLIQLGANSGLAFSQGIYGHGLWLERSCALHLRKALREFFTAYSQLAHFSMHNGHVLFGFVPKLHALAHFKQDFDSFLRTSRSKCLNPGIYDCSMNEDFIGAISKQSRRVAFKRYQFERTVLTSYLVKTKMVLNKFMKERLASRGAP